MENRGRIKINKQTECFDIVLNKIKFVLVRKNMNFFKNFESLNLIIFLASKSEISKFYFCEIFKIYLLIFSKLN